MISALVSPVSLAQNSRRLMSSSDNLIRVLNILGSLVGLPLGDNVSPPFSIHNYYIICGYVCQDVFAICFNIAFS